MEIENRPEFTDLCVSFSSSEVDQVWQNFVNKNKYSSDRVFHRDAIICRLLKQRLHKSTRVSISYKAIKLRRSVDKGNWLTQTISYSFKLINSWNCVNPLVLDLHVNRYFLP